MKQKFDLELKINELLSNDEREFMNLKPNYYVLEIHANELLELINLWKLEDEKIDDLVLSIEREILIFKSDIPGHLKKDLRNGNKSYRDNWIILKEVIDGMKLKLLKIWKEYKLLKL